MSTVKISQLAELTTLNANTQNTLFVSVDVPSSVTGKVTAKTLSQNLYSRNPLKVGLLDINFPNTIAQFANTSNNYVQVNLVNQDNDGTGDYVVTANTGSDTEFYIDMGYTNAGYNPDSPFNSLGTSINPLDGYLYVQGSDAIGGNLVIGTTTANSVIRVLVGGVNISNVSAIWTPNGLRFNTNRYLTFADDTVQNTAAASNAYSQASFALANSVNSYAYSVNSYAYGANTWLQSWTTTNFLANTTGTLAGSLTITNNLNTRGFINFANSNISSTQALVTISASNTGVTQTPGGDGYVLHMTGKHDTPVRVVADSFGANGQLVFPIFGGRAARGNVTNPSAVQTNDILTRLAGSGFGSTSYQPGGLARIDIVASENHTDAARGTAIKFYNIPNGSNVVNQIATFNANTAEFIGTVQPQKGFVFIPRLPVGDQTAITINYANDSIIKANLTADLTISHTSYVAGKVVEVWLVNTSGQNRTVTHGCSAINSTNKSTTVIITAGSSMYLRFFSIDGDNANTFVSIIG